MLGNLEGSVADAGTARHKGAGMAWKADARQISAVESVGFDAMTVANNHMMDFGHEGMLATLANMDRVGIKHAGGGRNYAEAHAPAIIERDGCRVALLGYTSVFMADWEAGPESAGLAVMKARTAYQPHERILEAPGSPPTIRSWVLPEYKDKLREDVAAARQKADIVICGFHWGVSAGFRKLTEYQVELGRHAVDVGADLVFGHHPHLIQGIEMYRGRAIFYSLGNFTFARHNPAKGHELETLIVRCRIRDRRIAEVAYIPARCDENLDPRALDLERGRSVVDIVAQRSEEFSTKLVAEGDAVQVG